MLRADFPNAKMRILAVAAAAMMLTACGGGSGPETVAATTPQMAMKAIQAKAAQLKAQQVPIEDAATQLMDFAEETFPNLFPPGPANAFAEIFHFRYYPSTDNYLGVSTMNVGPFHESNVYIVGSSFGNTLANPIDMGPLTTYITPTGGGDPGGGGTGNGCFDLSLADAQGTVIDVSYNYSGTITGTTRVVTTVGGLTTFEGQSARSTAVVTTGTGGAANFAATGNTYSLRDGDNMRHFGSQFVASVGAGGFMTNTTIKSVYNPPYLDTTYTLAMGSSVTLNQMGTAYTTISVTGSPFPIPDQNMQSGINTSTTHTYVGNESVTVPAGTFQACKYTTVSSGSSVVTTTWYAKPKGIPVKITSEGQVIQATQATVAGAPL